jgi:glycine cleavage system H lipoate-binding protein
MNYTVTLTETEKLAMEYVAYEPQDWVENAFKERARIAIDEIVKLAVEKFLAANQTIPGSKEEIVAAAYSNGWIQTLKYRTDNASNEPI